MKDEIKEKCSNCEYSRQCFTMKQVNPECCLKDRKNEKKDEIKEILDKLKKQHSIDIKLGKEIANDFAEYKLNYKEMTLLLDCITNLREENERLNSVINNEFAPICIEKMIDKLSATEMIVLQEKEIKNYKSRNEKALEINQKLQMMSILDSRATLWLFKQEKVLQGEDKDVNITN